MFTYAVRWLNTQFPGGDSTWKYRNSIVESMRFELTTTRQRSFSIAPANVRIGEGRIGLLLDWPNSTVAAIFKDDVYTLPEQIGRRNIKSYRLMARSSYHDTPKAAKKVHTTRVKKGYYIYYWEAIGDNLKFAGIVTHPHATKNDIRNARNLSRMFGIPYLGKLGSFKPSAYFGVTK